MGNRRLFVTLDGLGGVSSAVSADGVYLTPRGQAILAHTPMGRFGQPEVIWLASPASAFVTGAVIPVDGGFNAYSGV